MREKYPLLSGLPMASRKRKRRDSHPGKPAMDTVRLTPENNLFPRIPCDRCGEEQGYWDRLADKPLCPSCLESLAVGEADPLVLRTEPRRCAVCFHQGALCYQTFPLRWNRPIELDLCG